ncbi:MAG: rod shape-determining protein MreD [Proteobacteria bacterium]|nr:rod shape-determining protein MreD [Pseudomonadota bacterium]
MVPVPLAARVAPAIAFILLLALLSMQSFTLSSLLTVNMALVLHALYFWSVFRPRIFPAWLAFLLGFLIDIVSGRLLGLNAFLFVFIQLVILRQRRYLLSQPFATQWGAFLFLALVAEALRWGIMALVDTAILSPLPALTSAVCSAAIYPITALVMQACLRVISPYTSCDRLEG